MGIQQIINICTVPTVLNFKLPKVIFFPQLETAFIHFSYIGAELHSSYKKLGSFVSCRNCDQIFKLCISRTCQVLIVLVHHSKTFIFITL